MDERAENIEQLGVSNGMVIARAEGRRFPGVLVQGDTLFGLLRDLEEEAPTSVAADRVREWIVAYERFMAAHGLELPYSGRQ